jgi:hypothetical protein
MVMELGLAADNDARAWMCVGKMYEVICSQGYGGRFPWLIKERGVVCNSGGKCLVLFGEMEREESQGWPAGESKWELGAQQSS